jgi:hypothetical protein
MYVTFAVLLCCLRLVNARSVPRGNSARAPMVFVVEDASLAACCTEHKQVRLYMPVCAGEARHTSVHTCGVTRAELPVPSPTRPAQKCCCVCFLWSLTTSGRAAEERERAAAIVPTSCTRMKTPSSSAHGCYHMLIVLYPTAVAEVPQPAAARMALPQLLPAAESFAAVEPAALAAAVAAVAAAAAHWGLVLPPQLLQPWPLRQSLLPAAGPPAPSAL